MFWYFYLYRLISEAGRKMIGQRFSEKYDVSYLFSLLAKNTK